MCTFTLRVHSCGHYKKSLKMPCDDAKKKKEVCDSGSEDSSTTGMFCYFTDCDGEAGGVREGPGNEVPYGLVWRNLLISSQETGRTADLTQVRLIGRISVKPWERGVPIR